MMQQQMPQQIFQQQFQQQMMNIPLEDKNVLELIFDDQTENLVMVRINEQRLVKEAISLYMLKSGKTCHCRFIFNNRELYPEMKICQSGLVSRSRILVIELEMVKG